MCTYTHSLRGRKAAVRLTGIVHVMCAMVLGTKMMLVKYWAQHLDAIIYLIIFPASRQVSSGAFDAFVRNVNAILQ